MYIHIYIYVCTMVEERCVSRSIFITCLERRREARRSGGCSSETYESQRTRMQRTIVPGEQECFEYSSRIWV